MTNAQAADEAVTKYIDEFDALIEGCVKLGMKVPSHDVARRKLASMKEHGAFAVAVDAFSIFCTNATSYFGSLKELNILEVDVDTVDKFDFAGISDGAFELTSNSAKAVIEMVDVCLSVVGSPYVPLTSVVSSELINKVESVVRCGLRGIYTIANVETLEQTKRLKQFVSILESMSAIVRHNDLGKTSPENTWRIRSCGSQLQPSVRVTQSKSLSTPLVRH